MYTIEKGVPFNGTRASETRNFIEKLEIGDSFVCNSSEAQNIQTYAGQLKIKLARKKIDSTTSRVWRLS